MCPEVSEYIYWDEDNLSYKPIYLEYINTIYLNRSESKILHRKIGGPYERYTTSY
jgi:hypothetical protein